MTRSGSDESRAAATGGVAASTRTSVESTQSTDPPSTTIPNAAPVDLQGPTGLFERDGVRYIAHAFGNTVYRRAADGSMTVVAGNGKANEFTKSVPAKEVNLNSPTGTAVSPDGTLWTDNGNDLVRRVCPAGSLTSVAGLHQQRAFNGDGEAVARSFNPYALAFGPDGQLYISGPQNHLVRTLSNGVVETVAGTVVDGKPEAGAADGRLSVPLGIVVDADNNLYIAKRGNNRVV